MSTDAALKSESIHVNAVVLQKRTDPAELGDSESESKNSCCIRLAIDVLDNCHADNQSAKAMESTVCRISHAGQRSTPHDTALAWLESVAFSDQLDPFRDDWPFW